MSPQFLSKHINPIKSGCLHYKTKTNFLYNFLYGPLESAPAEHWQMVNHSLQMPSGRSSSIYLVHSAWFLHHEPHEPTLRAPSSSSLTICTLFDKPFLTPPSIGCFLSGLSSFLTSMLCCHHWITCLASLGETASHRRTPSCLSLYSQFLAQCLWNG